MICSEMETMETMGTSSGEAGGVGATQLIEQVNYTNLNGGTGFTIGDIDYLSIGGDAGGSFQALETICELNSSSAMPYLYANDPCLDSGGGGGIGGNLEGTVTVSENGGGSSDNFEASLITLNDISNSYHGNPLASLGALEGWTNGGDGGGMEEYNWMNNGENFGIPVAAQVTKKTSTLSTCSTSLYNFYEEDEKECQKDLDEILKAGGGDFGGDPEEEDAEDVEADEKVNGGVKGFPPTKATSLEYAVKSKPPQLDKDKEDDTEEDNGGDQEVNSEEDEETVGKKGKKERVIREERCSVCNLDFVGPSRFERHMLEVHDEKWPYPCEHDGCTKKFAKRHQRLQHGSIHDPNRFEGKGRWECGLCEKRYHVRCSLYQHWKSNHPGVTVEERRQLIAKSKEKIGGGECGGGGGGVGIRVKTETVPKVGAGVTQEFRRMKKRQILEEKKRRRSEETVTKEEEVILKVEEEIEAPAPSGDLACQVCGKGFNGRWDLKQHLMLHTGEKPIRCPKCPERFRLRQTLANHLRRKHRSRKERRNILKMYKCRVCGRDDFEMWGDAYSHRLRGHREVKYEREKEKPFGCGICLKPFFLREDAIICSVLGHKAGGKGREGREREEEIRRKGLKGVEGMGFESALYFDLTEKGPSEMEQHLVAKMILEVMGNGGGGGGGRDGRQICTLCGEEVSNKGNFKRHLNLVHVSEEMAKKEEVDAGQDEEEEEAIEEDKVVEEEVEPPKKKVKEETVVREEEGISVFKCRFCDKEFAKKRALHFHEVRGHINPKKPEEGKKEVAGAGRGDGAKKGKKGAKAGKKKVEKVVVVEEEEETGDDSDSSNGSDLFIEVVKRKRGGWGKKEEMLKLRSVNLRDPVAVANALDFKNVTVKMRGLSREEILGMNGGRIGNLEFLDGDGTWEEVVNEANQTNEEDGGGRRSGRRRTRPPVQVPPPVAVEEERLERRTKRGGGRGGRKGRGGGGGSQGEKKTEKKSKGKRGRPPKKKRGRWGWGKKKEKGGEESEEEDEDKEEDGEEEDDEGTGKMANMMKGVAKRVVKLRVEADEENSGNEVIDRQAEVGKEGDGSLEGMGVDEDDSCSGLGEKEENKDSNGSSEVKAPLQAEEVDDNEEDSDEEDEDMEEMIQEELEEMMEEAQLDDWLAEAVADIPNVPAVEGEDSVQFLAELSGSEGEEEEEGPGLSREGGNQEEIRRILIPISDNDSTTTSESESDTEDEEEEDLEDEELIAEGDNANQEAIVPMHHDESEDDEEGRDNFEEDPLNLEDFSPPPTPRNPPPRSPIMEHGEVVNDEDEEDEDEEVDVEGEEEPEGTVSSTTVGYPVVKRRTYLDDSSSSANFESGGSGEGTSQSGGGGGGGGSGSGGSSRDSLPLRRNIPGINPNLVRGLPTIVLRRIEMDHTLNVKLALIRNNNGEESN